MGHRVMQREHHHQCPRLDQRDGQVCTYAALDKRLCMVGGPGVKGHVRIGRNLASPQRSDVRQTKIVETVGDASHAGLHAVGPVAAGKKSALRFVDFAKNHARDAQLPAQLFTGSRRYFFRAGEWAQVISEG
jgi:hypothetical protein